VAEPKPFRKKKSHETTKRLAIMTEVDHGGSWRSLRLGKLTIKLRWEHVRDEKARRKRLKAKRRT